MKTSRFFHLLRNIIMDIITSGTNLLTSSGLLILLHGIYSLPAAMSCDKRCYTWLSMLVSLPLTSLFVCLIWFFTPQSTIFQLCQDGSSWVEPVLSKDQCVLPKDTTQWRRWGSNLWSSNICNNVIKINFSVVLIYIVPNTMKHDKDFSTFFF